MKIRLLSASALALALALSFGVANADTALSVTCSGSASATGVAWTAAAAGGVAPYAYLWGNGATSSSQTISYAPGTYSMTIQATDASSSMATSTCSATVQEAAPTISSFTATPSTITSGQTSLLSWAVSNASTTSVDNGVGVVTGTSVGVAPTVTTTYTLTASNPIGTTTADATVTVGTATSTGSGSVQEQIQALLNEIAQLKQQIAQLIGGQIGSTGTTTPPVVPPGQVGKAACIALNRNLSEGDSGDDVRNVQEMLASNPAYGYTASTTGYFGPITARAMIRYQEMNGIASSTGLTGFVGPLTRGFFQRHCGEGLGNVPGPNGPRPLPAEGEGGANASSTEGQLPSVMHPMIPYTGPASAPGLGNENGHGNGNGNSGDHGNGNGNSGDH